MKSIWLSVCIFLIAALASPAWGTGSLSGTVSYNGSQSGSTYVAVYTTPISCSAPNPDPFRHIQLASPGNYQISGLPDGNYYVASVVMTCGNDCKMSLLDPWGIYNGCNDIKPVTINGGSVTDIKIVLEDGTKTHPNPFARAYKSYYLGVTGNASGFIGFEKSLDELSYFGFSVTGDGGGMWSGVEAILPFGTHSPPLKYLPPQAGQTWSDEGDSNGEVINSTTVVQSVNETIMVAAGTFTNCAHVHETLSWPNGDNPTSYVVGFDRWLCPGIGPAKLIITNYDGEQYSGELASYTISTIDSADYFPLELGYQWRFNMDDGRSATWTVNAIAPDVVIDSKPSNPSTQTTATFSFSSSNTTATFECKIDASAFTVCQSPYSYPNLSYGTHTFSVRAKDTGGYVTINPASYSWNIISITPTETLTITTNGTGTGSVHSEPSGLIACTYPPQNGICETTQQVNTQLTLIADPGDDSIFGGWSDACSGCSGLSCLVTLDSNRGCSVTFSIKPPVRIAGENYFTSIINAYSHLSDGVPAEIQAQAVELTEDIDFNHTIPLTLQGGFDNEFKTLSDFTTLHGTLTLSHGSMTVDRLIVR